MESKGHPLTVSSQQICKWLPFLREEPILATGTRDQLNFSTKWDFLALFCYTIIAIHLLKINSIATTSFQRFMEQERKPPTNTAHGRCVSSCPCNRLVKSKVPALDPWAALDNLIFLRGIRFYPRKLPYCYKLWKYSTRKISTSIQTDSNWRLHSNRTNSCEMPWLTLVFLV